YLSTRRTPRSTVFPYTTLFRSRCNGLSAWAIASSARGPVGLELVVHPTLSKLGIADQPFQGAPGRVKPWLEGYRIRVLDGNHLADRKSTRLNSSHLVISYAVFC